LNQVFFSIHQTPSTSVLKVLTRALH